nr:hypothetical protein [Tanacetum cinerariifolium]
MFPSFGRGRLGISPRMHRIMQDINIVDGTSEDFPSIISNDTHMILHDLKLDVAVLILISLCLKKVGKWEIILILINVAANPPAKPPPREPLQKMNTDIFKCRDAEKFQPKSGFEVIVQNGQLKSFPNVSINGGYSGGGCGGGDHKSVGREFPSSRSHGAMFPSFGRGRLGRSHLACTGLCRISISRTLLINVAANPPGKPPPREPLQKMNTDIFKCRDGEKFQPKSGFEVNLVLALIQLTSHKMGGWYLKYTGDKQGDTTKVPEKEDLIFEQTKGKLMVQVAAEAAAGNQFAKYSTGTATFGPESLYDNIFRCRNKGENYTLNSPYHKNLMSALTALPKDKMGGGWFLQYAGDKPELDPWFWVFLASTTSVKADIERFDKLRYNVVVRLSAEAAAGNQFAKYATGTESYNGSTLYMAMQCTADIGQDACNQCFLPIMFMIHDCCSGKEAAAIISPNCYMRYAHKDFRNS